MNLLLEEERGEGGKRGGRTTQSLGWQLTPCQRSGLRVPGRRGAGCGASDPAAPYAGGSRARSARCVLRVDFPKQNCADRDLHGGKAAAPAGLEQNDADKPKEGFRGRANPPLPPRPPLLPPRDAVDKTQTDPD